MNSSLETCPNNYITSKILKTYVELLIQGKIVELMWVKAYIGIQGNEIV